MSDAKQKLIMILGVQRSGTTALFETLATAPGLTSYHEAADDAVYFDYYLRPEPEIRSVLQAAPNSVLLKPVRESELRSLHSLFDEYAAYDLQIIWLYRDPVNVLYSYERKGWANRDAFESLGQEWALRNQAMLEALPQAQEHLTIVRYEDLLQDPTLVHALAHRFDLQIRSTLATDSNAGRKKLPLELQETIDQITARTLTLLDQTRTLRPALQPLAPSDPVPIKEARSLGAIWRGWISPLKKSQATAKQIAPHPEPPAPQITPAQSGELLPLPGTEAFSIQPDLYSLEFRRDPYACFERWRQSGSVHFLPWQKIWLVLNYDDVATVLRDSTRFINPKSVWSDRVLNEAAPSRRVDRQQQLALYFTQESAQAWTVTSAQRFRNLLTTASESGSFDWTEICGRFLPPLFSDMLGVKPEYAETFADMVSQGASWEQMSTTLSETGLLKQIIADGQWSSNELHGFVIASSRLFCQIVSTFLGNALFELLAQPQWMGTVRQEPGQLPALVVELLRLMPPMLTIECSTRCDVVIGDTAIPAGSRIYVAPGAANRDPIRFEQANAVRLHRPPPAPITFSVGSNAHRCLGEYLARLTSVTILNVLLTEFPAVRSAQSLEHVEFSNHLIWNDCILIKSPQRLDVTFVD